MIEISGLCKTYNAGRANELNSIQSLDLSIANAEFVVLIGTNGSGKSTLLNCIAGSVAPTSGTVAIDGIDITEYPDFKRSRWIGRVFQNPLSGTAPGLSILENFRLAALRTEYKHIKLGIDEAFRSSVREKIAMLGMNLEHKLDQPMGTLSGGQRQALTLLMCVMDNLKILLLDEPTAALDPRSAKLVMETADALIKQYQLTALMVTHQIKDACSYGSRLIQMEEGRIIRDVPQVDKKELRLSDIYGWFG